MGVESYKFAKKADCLIVLASVLGDVELDKQREVARDLEKKGSSARHFRNQPVRHWDHWLHENTNLANTHVIAYASDGRTRVDLTPDAKREMSVEPEFDVSPDGRQVAVTWQSPGEDRETDTAIALIDIASKNIRIVGAATNTNNESPLYAPDGKTLAVIRATRSPTTVVRPTLTLINVATDRWLRLQELRRVAAHRQLDRGRQAHRRRRRPARARASISCRRCQRLGKARHARARRRRAF